MIAFDFTLGVVSAGTALIGAAAGGLGSFAVLRRESLLGDAIAHASLPGVALAFILTLAKAPLVLVLGAAIAGWVGTVCMIAVIRTSIVKTDASMGIVLSVFFGLGIILLTYIQRLPTASKAGLNAYLFGNASTLLVQDVVVMAILSLTALSLLALFWKEFKLLTFDEGFARGIGLPGRGLTISLTSLIVVSIVIGLQAVGVVLMSALLIAPAVAARQLTSRLGLMVVISALIGAGAGIFGALFSASVERLPTGPSIVVFASLAAALSLLFAPGRGLVSAWVRAQRNRRAIDSARVLRTLHELRISHPGNAHPLSSIQAVNERWVMGTLKALLRQGLVEQDARGNWRLSRLGVVRAREIAERGP